MQPMIEREKLESMTREELIAEVERLEEELIKERHRLYRQTEERTEWGNSQVARAEKAERETERLAAEVSDLRQLVAINEHELTDADVDEACVEGLPDTTCLEWRELARQRGDRLVAAKAALADAVEKCARLEEMLQNLQQLKVNP